MKCRTFIFLLLMLSSFVTAASAQIATSDAIKPRWLHKLPMSTNDTFIYDVVVSSAYSLEDARSMALQSLISDAGMKSGVVIVSDHKSTETVSQVWENGKLKEVIKNDMETVDTVKGQEVSLHASYIDEYWTQDKNGIYHLQRLYAKSELGKMPLYDDVDKTTSYVSDPATWGLALIPCAAQIHKGSYLKGGLILGGTVVLVGGIIFTENQRADYMHKIAKTHNANIKRAYATKRDHFATGRNICIGAAAALYVYNLIDAIVAPGARRIVIKKQSNGNTYTVLPAISAGGNPMIAASITF